MLIFIVCFFIICFYGCKIRRNECYLDNEEMKCIRGAMAILIVLVHTCTNVWLAYENSILNFLLQCFIGSGYLAVGIFFLFSGYGLMYSKINKKNYLNGFLNSRLPAILIPFIISNCIYLFGTFYMGDRYSIGEIIYSFININIVKSNSWYIVVITFLYIIFYFTFNKLNEKKGIAVISSIVIGFMLILYIFNVALCWYVSTIPFIIGIIIAQYDKVIFERINKKFLVYLILTLGAFFIFYKSSIIVYKITSEVSIGAEIVEKIFSSTIFAMLFIILTTKVIFGNKVLCILGDISLEIYLIHGIVIRLVRFWGINNNFMIGFIVILMSIIASIVLKKVDKGLINIYKKATCPF